MHDKKNDALGVAVFKILQLFFSKAVFWVGTPFLQQCHFKFMMKLRSTTTSTTNNGNMNMSNNIRIPPCTVYVLLRPLGVVTGS
jgi:hypothetical protein